MKESIILFGAGSAGRYALKNLRAQGIEPVAFADNDHSKHGTEIDGIPVAAPESVMLLFDAVWVATAISRPAATELRAQLDHMGVKTKPLWEVLPVCHGIPTGTVMAELYDLCGDQHSKNELQKQYSFRKFPDYERQNDPSPISELYFPDFITHRDDEHFVDCGACDGDTVKLFTDRWPNYRVITAIEPDNDNYAKLRKIKSDKMLTYPYAVSDHKGLERFTSNGDYSSHLGGAIASAVDCITLDSLFYGAFNTYASIRVPPTYIKADVEGSELELLWGARKIIKEHSPVLAICAYHTSDHLWEIPLLVHAIQPEYKCYLRRYAEGAFELVWYFVPPERVK